MKTVKQLHAQLRAVHNEIEALRADSWTDVKDWKSPLSAPPRLGQKYISLCDACDCIKHAILHLKHADMHDQ